MCEFMLEGDYGKPFGILVRYQGINHTLSEGGGGGDNLVG